MINKFAINVESIVVMQKFFTPKMINHLSELFKKQGETKFSEACNIPEITNDRKNLRFEEKKINVFFDRHFHDILPSESVEDFEKLKINYLETTNNTNLESFYGNHLKYIPDDPYIGNVIMFYKDPGEFFNCCKVRIYYFHDLKYLQEDFLKELDDYIKNVNSDDISTFPNKFANIDYIELILLHMHNFCEPENYKEFTQKHKSILDNFFDLAEKNNNYQSIIIQHYICSIFFQKIVLDNDKWNDRCKYFIQNIENNYLKGKIAELPTHAEMEKIYRKEFERIVQEEHKKELDKKYLKLSKTSVNKIDPKYILCAAALTLVGSCTLFCALSSSNEFWNNAFTCTLFITLVVALIYSCKNDFLDQYITESPFGNVTTPINHNLNTNDINV